MQEKAEVLGVEGNQTVRCAVSYLVKIILISPTVGANSERSIGGIEAMISMGYGLDPMKVKAYQSSWNRSRNWKTILTMG